MITHISGPCTSCDWIPVKTCENYKNGTWPKCCPNLESEHKMIEATEHIAYLDEETLQQVKLDYDEWDNSWCLNSQGRRSHLSFKGETIFHLTGRETYLLKFKWLAGRIFVRVNHTAASRNVRGWERSLIQSLLQGETELWQFIKNTFGLKIEELFWKETVDATKVKPSECDWFEVYHNPSGYTKLSTQANDKVLEVQRAIMAKEFIERSEFADFAYCFDTCIGLAQARLRSLLTLGQVSMHTDPDDLPNSLLDSESEICEMKLAAFAKPYEKWLTTEERGDSTD